MSEETYKFRTYHIPSNMLRSLKRFITVGARPGNFLMSVLENNLFDALRFADDTNINNLPAYTAYLYNDAPSYCWGSPKKVQQWIVQGGLTGKAA